eukprot:TRINITY_DN14441_c0_g4_i1.p1 TRINITY_DN14441_c0_g4~~TRINITY_DN14441_c0_g4_i1.p1  ORF type:complete len:597 (-),score=182.88 TRINITY_DN14441_c0_g4_i1:315-2105(-)
MKGSMGMGMGGMGLGRGDGMGSGGMGCSGGGMGCTGSFGGGGSSGSSMGGGGGMGCTGTFGGGSSGSSGGMGGGGGMGCTGTFGGGSSGSSLGKGGGGMGCTGTFGGGSSGSGSGMGGGGLGGMGCTGCFGGGGGGGGMGGGKGYGGGYGGDSRGMASDFSQQRRAMYMDMEGGKDRPRNTSQMSAHSNIAAAAAAAVAQPTELKFNNQKPDAYNRFARKKLVQSIERAQMIAASEAWGHWERLGPDGSAQQAAYQKRSGGKGQPNQPVGGGPIQQSQYKKKQSVQTQAFRFEGIWMDSHGNPIHVVAADSWKTRFKAKLNRNGMQSIMLEVVQLQDGSWQCGNATLDYTRSTFDKIFWVRHDGHESAWIRCHSGAPQHLSDFLGSWLDAFGNPIAVFPGTSTSCVMAKIQRPNRPETMLPIRDGGEGQGFICGNSYLDVLSSSSDQVQWCSNEGRVSIWTRLHTQDMSHMFPPQDEASERTAPQMQTTPEASTEEQPSAQPSTEEAAPQSAAPEQPAEKPSTESILQPSMDSVPQPHLEQLSPEPSTESVAPPSSTPEPSSMPQPTMASKAEEAEAAVAADEEEEEEIQQNTESV